MQAGLDGAERDLKVLGDLGVGEALEVCEKEDFTKLRGHAVNRSLDHGVPFAVLHRGIGRRDVDLQKIDEGCRSRSVVPHRRREIDGLAASLLTEVVTPLVRGDRKKPRTECAFSVEGVCREVDLDPRLLEDIFGGLSVSHEPVQEGEQLVVVTPDKGAKDLCLARTVTVEEDFVGWSGVRIRHARSDPVGGVFKLGGLRIPVLAMRRPNRADARRVYGRSGTQDRSRATDIAEFVSDNADLALERRTSLGAKAGKPVGAECGSAVSDVAIE